MKIYKDKIRRIAWGTDASFYRLTPKKVVIADSESDVSNILKKCYKRGMPVTFRAAGTSLSGQSISDSLLLVAGNGWEKYSVEKDAITLQPGIVGARVNQILSSYGRKFGPDPASIGSCMVGGIVANNASGMSCGVSANSDHLLRSVRIVLSDGTVLDTASSQSRLDFERTHPHILQQIESIRKEIVSDDAFRRRIEYKYSIKNVTGLNLRPFVAYEDPFEIIAHLMVGSEGTLAFLSEFTMSTLPLENYSCSAMIYFNSIEDAARAVVKIRPLSVSAAELLDRRSLQSVNDNGGDTALLIQVTAASEEELQKRAEAVTCALEDFVTVNGVNFTSDSETVARYWKIRSGIFPTVGALRRPGTTSLIEDVAFHIEDLPSATRDLSNLLDKHGYEDSCIYGHALEGNFHFIINQSFSLEQEKKRYQAFIEDVVSMVVDKYDGSLKAEHGTGRNMAPFVLREWGDKAFQYMKRIKRAFDSKGILNPGVIFNDDEMCYLKDIKSLPVLGLGNIDKCIECGFCEVNCMSCGFTLSSRTRIVMQRELKAGHLGWSRRLRYLAMDTCAGDGLCSTSCPMGINVAELTHLLRENNTSSFEAWLGRFAARNFSRVKSCMRLVLCSAHFVSRLIGKKCTNGFGRFMHMFGLPLWTYALPKAYRMEEWKNQEGEHTVVYLPSCINQTMGTSDSSPYERPLVEETLNMLRRTGFHVIIPQNREKLCCGMIWESKGQSAVAAEMLRETESALRECSQNGRWPVLCDQSPCLHRLRKNIQGISLYEPAEFIYKFILPKVHLKKTHKVVALHLTCSSRLMGVDKMMVQIAERCAQRVLIPQGVGCCGFAGDKGFLRPELNAWGLRKVKAQILECDVHVGFSNSRTCEIGLQNASNIPYVSIVYLVNESIEEK